MCRWLVVRALAEAALLLGLASACYGPHVAAGSPCSAIAPCPAPLTCDLATMTCSSGSGMGTDAGALDSAKPIDAVPDASLEPANDNPADATLIGPLTGQGSAATIIEDVTYAMSNASGDGSMQCGSSGRTVFFQLEDKGTNIYYFDTFGSTYDTIIRVYPGNCVAGAAPNNTVCNDDACNRSQSQLALNIKGTGPMGGNTNSACIEIAEDPSNGSAAMANLVLHVERAAHADGMSINVNNGASPPTLAGNTCNNETAQWTGDCGGSQCGVGYEDVYFFTQCPGTSYALSASTCNGSSSMTYDMVLYLRETGSNMQLAAQQEDGTCVLAPGAASLTDVGLDGAHLYTLVVDSVGSGTGSCGAYGLTATTN